MIINTPATNLAALANMVAALGALGFVRYKLFTNNFLPQPTNVLSDFTEAAFPGYAESSTITWNQPYLDTQLNANVVGQELQFTLSSSTTTVTCYGYFVVGKQGSDTVGTTLVFSEAFPAPVALTYAGQAVPLLPTYQFAQG